MRLTVRVVFVLCAMLRILFFFSGSVYAQDGYTLPSAQDIEGIEEGGVYDPGEFSFTANIVQANILYGTWGDVRYMPVRWELMDEGYCAEFALYPYGGSFTLLAGGDYTLCVTYEQYTFGGDMWHASSETTPVFHTVQIHFSVQPQQPATAPVRAYSKWVCVMAGGIVLGGGVVYWIKRKKKNR